MTNNLNLTDTVNRFQLDFQDKLDQKTKEFRELFEEVDCMKMTNLVLTAIYYELVRLNISDDFEGDVVLSINAVFGSPHNDLVYDESNSSMIKSTLEKHCNWITLDTSNKHFVIKNHKTC